VKLAFLVYDQFTLMDLAGPVEVLRGWPRAEVHYVACSARPPYDTGSPHKAGDPIVGRSLAALRDAAHASGASGVSLPFTMPSTTEALR
jgi:putative intracellular protease/amidase